jgi:hypothetical protein
MSSTSGDDRPGIFRCQHFDLRRRCIRPRKTGARNFSYSGASAAEFVRCFIAQVLQEYFSAATRKLGVAAETAQRKVEILAGAK